MKSHIRKMARSAAGVPGLGRLVRIGVAVIRLPEMRDAQRQFDAELLQRMTGHGVAGPGVLNGEQLPALLQAVSDLNHRQMTADRDQHNLVRSVPIALRKLTRDVVELRAGGAGAAARIGACEEELARAQAALRTAMRDLGEELRAAQSDIKDRQQEQFAEAAQRQENLAQSINYLLGRVEFVRREVMFEMRYGARNPGQEAATSPATSEIVDAAKVEAARATGLRLNLGSGHVPLPGYLNVDRRALPGVDIVAEVNALPFEKGELSEICSAHMLEHFPEEQLRRELLPYWISLLKEDGVFRAIVPDGKAMAEAYVRSEYSFDTLRQVTFGGQDYDGDFHFNMFSPASLSQMLQEQGLAHVDIVAENRENGGCKEFEIVARRTAADVA